MADLSKEWDSAKPIELEWEKATPLGATSTAKPKMQKIGVEGLPDAVRQVVSETGPMANFAVGFKSFIDDAAMRLKQLTGQELTPQQVTEVLANRALRDQSTAATIGNVTGAIAATGSPATALMKGGTALASRVLPAVVAPTVASAAVGGGLAAATEPVMQGETTLDKATAGAIGGAVGDAALRVGARIAQPIMQSPAVARLLGNGVVPTPGQAAGADSVLGRTEQKLQSVFGVGEVVKHGRDRAATEFNVAALNRGMPEGKVAEAGNAGMQQLRDALSAGYDRVYAGRTVQPDRVLANAIVAAKQVPLLPLNEANEKAFDAAMKKVVWDRIPQVNMGAGSVLAIPADKMKQEIIGELGQLSRKHLKSPLASEQALGEAFAAARDAAQGWLKTEVAKSSPQAAAAIDTLERAYANRVGLKKAADKAAATGGVFTPNQLQRSAPEATGLRQLANDAQEILSSRVPNSGTIDRGTLAMLIGGGAAGANSYIGGPEYLTALAAAPLLYSRAVSRYMIGDLVPGQQLLSRGLRSVAPYAAIGGAAAANP